MRSSAGRHSKAFPDDANPRLMGEVPAFSTETFTKMRLGTLDRTTLLALLAARQALAEARLAVVRKDRGGVF